MDEKPQCAVRGAIRPGAMCSRILVGRELCGFAGECEHQIKASENLMYPAKFHPEGRYFVVSFRDLPAAITQGHGFEEALEMAQDAAACALEMLAEQGANAPVPSAPHPGEVMVLPKRAE